MNAIQKRKRIDLYNYIALFVLFAICTTVLTIQGLGFSNNTLEQEHLIASDNNADS